MKKGIVIILAVAIIGLLGAYSKSHGSNVQATSNGVGSKSLVAGASTTTSNKSSSSSSTTTYKDGTYTGASEDTPYGTVQIAVVVSGGKITDVNFLQMPSDLPHSQEVTSIAGPLLKQETIQRQGHNLDFVSGATSTSEGYAQSLQAALDQAA